MLRAETEINDVAVDGLEQLAVEVDRHVSRHDERAAAIALRQLLPALQSDTITLCAPGRGWATPGRYSGPEFHPGSLA